MSQKHSSATNVMARQNVSRPYLYRAGGGVIFRAGQLDTISLQKHTAIFQN